MSAGLTLVCPIRGRLKAKARSKDGLTLNRKERYRVKQLSNLIRQGYPQKNFIVEAPIKRLLATAAGTASVPTLSSLTFRNNY